MSDLPPRYARWPNPALALLIGAKPERNITPPDSLCLHIDLSDSSPILQNRPQQLSSRCIGGASTPTRVPYTQGNVTHRKYQNTSLKHQALSRAMKNPGRLVSLHGHVTFLNIKTQISQLGVGAQRRLVLESMKLDGIGANVCVFVVRTRSEVENSTAASPRAADAHVLTRFCFSLDFRSLSLGNFLL